MSQEKFTGTAIRIDALIKTSEDTLKPEKKLAILENAFSQLDHQGLRPEDYGLNEDQVWEAIGPNCPKSFSTRYPEIITKKADELIKLYFNK